MATDMDYDGKKLFSKYDPITEDGKALMLQPFYPIINTDRDKSIKHTFIDFSYNDNPVIKIGSVNADIVETEILLQSELIEIKNESSKMDSVLDHLNKKFTKLAEIEGDKSREKGPYSNIDGTKVSKFDMDYSNIDGLDQHMIDRKIITKINLMSSYIAVDGRIGPGHYIITNSKTNEFLLNLYGKYGGYDRLTYAVDDQLEDGKVVMGRKNDERQPGIILAIYENSLENVVYNEERKLCVNFKYSFTSVGFHPEKQYYTMYIKNKF